MMRVSNVQVLFAVLALSTLLFIYINYRFAQISREDSLFTFSASLAEKPLRPRVIIYNRVPKTGSTTFTNAIAYDLFKQNGFNVVHLNITKNRQILSLPDQASLVRNISEWTERHPLFLHGHAAYVDFEQFGYPSPVYINIVREPLERLLSHYYFLRYGDNFRIGLKRSRAGNNETFDECIVRGGHDCDVKQMWLQIPYFCGHHHFCTEVGSVDALEQAKSTLLNKYLLVGSTDRIRDMIALLDATLPAFFRGALAHFDSLDEQRAHLRNTKRKLAPNEKTLSLVRNTPVYRMEREFYEFAIQQFDAVFKKATNGTADAADIFRAESQFHYEKIKPAENLPGHALSFLSKLLIRMSRVPRQ